MSDYVVDVIIQRFAVAVSESGQNRASLLATLGAPTAVPLVAATETTVVEFLCDASQSRTYQITLVVTGGAVYTRTVTIGHNGSAAADATTAEGHYSGDLIPAAELTAWALSVSGVGASQVVRLRATLASGGTAYVSEIPHRPPQRAS